MNAEFPPPDLRLADKARVVRMEPNARPDRAEAGGDSSLRRCDATNADGRGLIVRRASEIAPEAVDWLWPGRVAVGKHTCVAGEPGTGKSQLSIDVAATITTGRNWPCGEGQAPRGSVLILSAEDGEADTIVPRLIAAGADLDRVDIVSAVRNDNGAGRRSLNLQTDLDLLEAKIKEVGDVKVVVIDPISSYLGTVDSHRNAELRGVLEPIGEMAGRMRVAVLSITHFSKAGAGTATKALHRFIGSIAFVGAPRAAFVVIEDPEDTTRRLLLHAKNNLARPPQGLAFRVQQMLVADNIPASSIIWDAEPVALTADDVGDGKKATRSAKDEASEFLSELLSKGPMSVADLEREARAAGMLSESQRISQVKAFRSARDVLGIVPKKLGMELGWSWQLPKLPSTAEDAPVK
jgi:putative DNA primase/helicase